MCRWLAYAGPPIYLDSLIFEPDHSLIAQARHARRSPSTTNGDGFGIGWYAERREPGLLRDTLPAWSDENLRSVATQVRSPLFFAHVRASTGTATTRANCHPFARGNWMFMHNGRIGDFEALRHPLAMQLPAALFAELRGTTDSELMFLLAVANGLADDPAGALRRTADLVVATARAAGLEPLLALTAALTDGQSIHAVRHAHGAEAPSLFYARDGAAARVAPAATLVLSEPLDEAAESWVEVPEGHMLTARAGAVALAPFQAVDAP